MLLAEISTAIAIDVSDNHYPSLLDYPRRKLKEKSIDGYSGKNLFRIPGYRWLWFDPVYPTGIVYLGYVKKGGNQQ